jgi:hypothetical protein
MEKGCESKNLTGIAFPRVGTCLRGLKRPTYNWVNEQAHLSSSDPRRPANIHMWYNLFYVKHMSVNKEKLMRLSQKSCAANQWPVARSSY